LPFSHFRKKAKIKFALANLRSFYYFYFFIFLSIQYTIWFLLELALYKAKLKPLAKRLKHFIFAGSACLVSPGSLACFPRFAHTWAN
jgi:hypothetical protein